MVHLEHDLYFSATHSLLLLRNESIRKKHLTISNTKLNLVKKTTSKVCSILSKDIKNMKTNSPRNTKNAECHRNSIRGGFRAHQVSGNDERVFFNYYQHKIEIKGLIYVK